MNTLVMKKNLSLSVKEKTMKMTTPKPVNYLKEIMMMTLITDRDLVQV
jgi:hypothetical protein